MTTSFRLLAGATSALALLLGGPAHAVTTTFFDASQTASVDTSAPTSSTLTSNGYRFTYTQDKLFTGGVGMTTPIGRQEVVTWPAGIHAQAVTTPGPVGPAQITIQRVDGNTFDLSAFSFKLLGNTYATNADIEVTPILNGTDGSPVFLDATGYATRYGSTSFSYSTTKSDWRGFNTASLTGYDTYNLSLFVDYALTGVTLVDASVAAPVPEPETYAMMLGGLVLVGLAAKARGRARGTGAHQPSIRGDIAPAI